MRAHVRVAAALAVFFACAAAGSPAGPPARAPASLHMRHVETCCLEGDAAHCVTTVRVHARGADIDAPAGSALNLVYPGARRNVGQPSYFYAAAGAVDVSFTWACARHERVTWRLRGRGGVEASATAVAAAGCNCTRAGAVPPPPPPAFAPGPHPPLPQLVYRGGRVLARPRIQMIVFANNAYVDEMQAFAEAYAASSLWRDATSEYGVGVPSVAPLAVLGAAPSSIAFANVSRELLGPLFGNNNSSLSLGAPDADTIYMLVFPGTTCVRVPVGPGGEEACMTSVGTYGVKDTHLDAASGVRVPYGFVVESPPPPNPTYNASEFGVFDATTSFVAHELVEMATDPDAIADACWVGFALEFRVWLHALRAGEEVVDLCSNERPAAVRPQTAGFGGVTRSWSNAEARAGRDPCVPAKNGGLYFNSAVVAPGNVTGLVPAVIGFDGSVGGVIVVRVPGVHVPAGTSRAIELRLFSSAPTPAPWRVSAEQRCLIAPCPRYAFALDRTSGRNEDVVRLTITAPPSVAASGVIVALRVVSQLGDVVNEWFSAITS